MYLLHMTTIVAVVLDLLLHKVHKMRVAAMVTLKSRTKLSVSERLYRTSTD